MSISPNKNIFEEVEVLDNSALQNFDEDIQEETSPREVNIDYLEDNEKEDEKEDSEAATQISKSFSSKNVAPQEDMRSS